jgi:hypothetical protein
MFRWIWRVVAIVVLCVVVSAIACGPQILDPGNFGDCFGAADRTNPARSASDDRVRIRFATS